VTPIGELFQVQIKDNLVTQLTGVGYVGASAARKRDAADPTRQPTQNNFFPLSQLRWQTSTRNFKRCTLCRYPSWSVLKNLRWG
jgi:hypothetical protein